jgi:hypothetical protein
MQSFLTNLLLGFDSIEYFLILLVNDRSIVIIYIDNVEYRIGTVLW